MKKIVFITALFLNNIVNAQVIGINIGSSYPVNNKGFSYIPGSSGKFVSGNGGFAFSIFAEKDFKIKGVLFLNSKIEFSKSSLKYKYTTKATDNMGNPYDYTLEYAAINVYGVEPGIGIKIKGKSAFISMNCAPFVNNYIFNALVKAEAGVIIRERVTMHINLSRGLSDFEYGYKFERLAVGLGYIIGK